MPPLAPGPGGGDVVKKRKKRRKKRRMHASDVQLNPSTLHDMSTLGEWRVVSSCVSMSSLHVSLLLHVIATVLFLRMMLKGVYMDLDWLTEYLILVCCNVEIFLYLF